MRNRCADPTHRLQIGSSTNLSAPNSLNRVQATSAARLKEKDLCGRPCDPENLFDVRNKITEKLGSDNSYSF